MCRFAERCNVPDFANDCAVDHHLGDWHVFLLFNLHPDAVRTDRSAVHVDGDLLGCGYSAHAALGIPFVIITVTATLVGFDQSPGAGRSKLAGC
jgi:hypothetical protein